ncbi:MAG: putative manganese transporter [bacterium]|nr:putative manganese transporter [bacterium]
MLDIILDALVDSIKLLPFLFIVYVIMEFVEHKSNAKLENTIKKSGKYGPVLGGILGIVPQCGFSVMASNLYATGMITTGTLIAIFLSTSDEMLPIFLSNGIELSIIFKVLVSKAIIGIIFGFLIDFFIRRRKTQIKKNINAICNKEECHCDENIFLSSLKHTINIFMFILFINIFLNLIIYLVGKDSISNIFINNSFVGPIICSLVGLIPNCASSVIITQLFINGTITFGTMMSGLLCSSGMGVLMLFKVNKNKKDNITILLLTYLIGIFVGILLNFINYNI